MYVRFGDITCLLSLLALREPPEKKGEEPMRRLTGREVRGLEWFEVWRET